MGPFYCISLLALCGIGVLVQSHIPLKICENRLNSLTKQRSIIQKLVIKQERSVKWLETVCHLQLPDLTGTDDIDPIPTTVPPASTPSSTPTQKQDYPTTNYPPSTSYTWYPPTANDGENGLYPPIETTREWPRPPTTQWPRIPTTEWPRIPTREWSSTSEPQWPTIPTTQWPRTPITEWPTIPTPKWPQGIVYVNQTQWGPDGVWRPPTTRRPYPPDLEDLHWPTFDWIGTTYPQTPPTQPPTTVAPRTTKQPSPSSHPSHAQQQQTTPSIVGGNNGNNDGLVIYGEWTFNSKYEIELDALKTTVELIGKYGYPSETHYVTTFDSYILTLHRIPRPGAQPILLVHGLMSSSASWVQMGPSDGLAFLLYEQGFDVWMLNTRGNVYSKTHKRPNIKASEYWEFTFHEIGIYDLPNSIDLILSITKQPQLQYVGHSQGSTAFFVMCSELPHYNAKIALMQALSPTVYLQNSLSPVLRYLSLFKGEFSVLLNLLGGFEISRDNTLITQFRDHICTSNVLTSKICEIFDFVLAGFGWNQFNATLTPLVAGHASQGASTLQIYHYAQLINGLIFRRYDKGFLLNNIAYQSPEPPSYNLTNINCKVALHHSEDDWLSRSSDIEQLQYRLPNLLYTRQVPGFSHYDYLISKNVRSGLYADVLNECQRHRLVATISVAWEVHL